MRAFVVSELDGQCNWGPVDIEAQPSDATDLLVKVDYSGVNFKDALVASPASRVRRVATLTGGVDAAGVIVKSSDAALRVGTRVAVHGSDLGVARDGGFGA